MGSSESKDGKGSVDKSNESCSDAVAVVPYSGDTMLAFLDNDEVSMARINKKILDFKIHSDVTITAKDGTCFPCHKPFLATHSPVFAAMLEKDIQGSKSGILELQDMTGDGVKALLEYIYTCDFDMAMDRCEIALELLQAARNYEMMALEKRVCAILIKKETDWFTVDTAFSLFLFSRKNDHMNDIKVKAASVIMSNPNEFLECKAYKKELEENLAQAADALQELFWLATK